MAIIKVDRGGTSLFADWRPDDAEDPTTLTNLMLAAAADAAEALPGARLAGVVWYQGESDTEVTNPDPENHRARLGALFERSPTS